MIFHGKQPRPAMQCCYVQWSKVRLQAGHKLTKSSGSREQMSRNMYLLLGLAMTVKTLKNYSAENCKIHAVCLLLKTPRDEKHFCLGIYVAHALLNMGSLVLIVLWTVSNNQQQNYSLIM